MSSSNCQEAIGKLISKDLSGWAGLSPTCTLADIAAVRGVELGEEDTAAVLGEDALAASYRRARAVAFSEVLKLYVREGVVVRLSVRLPELPRPAALLAQLGPPEIKLDAPHATSPTVHRGGEWVYARRGLALVVASASGNVVELIAFAPTSPEAYRARLWYRELARESD